MKCTERLKKYEDTEFDVIILQIRNGTIKTGRYSHLVKVKDGKDIKGKELFKNATNSESE